MRGRFITVEGGEGSGKSVQIKLLAEYLTQNGHEIVLTKEPGGTEVGLALRHLLVEGEIGKMDARAESLLFFADRRVHVTQKILPALEAGKWVLSDRFADSTTAYQYYASQALSRVELKNLYHFSVGNLEPDLTLILDIDPQIGLERSFQKAAAMSVKETRNEMRPLEWHNRLRQGYLQIAHEEPNRCVVLNADQSIEALHAAIVETVRQRLGE
jgi:dTMP kinase